jgi:hypothetical protein
MNTIDLSAQVVPLKPLPPETVTERKELTRLIIVVALFLVFGFTVGGAFWGATTSHWENVKTLLDLLLPAETALLGTAVAFYMTE